jgi:cbb3-type cytochrome oxidase subunit 3
MDEVGKSVRQHMGAVEAVFHAVMLMFTCGVWYPVYRHRKNEIKRTTRHYS